MRFLCLSAAVLSLLVLTSSGMQAQQQPQTVDISQYAGLNEAEKNALVGGMSNLRLQDETQMMKLLTLAAQDASESVRRKAVQRAALTLAGLQDMARAGRPAPVSPQDLEALVSVVKTRVKDADRETRAAAYRALAASAAPDATGLEPLLLDCLRYETDAEMRGALISALTNAGYQSEDFKRVIVERLAAAEDKEFEALAAAAGRLGLVEALPVLMDRLGKPGTSQPLLLRALAAFGKLAQAAKPRIEVLLADPAFASPGEARTALAALEQEPRPQVIARFVNLIPASSEKAASPVTGVTGAQPATQASDRAGAGADAKAARNSADGTGSTLQLAVLAVMLAAGAGLIWLLLKSRGRR